MTSRALRAALAAGVLIGASASAVAAHVELISSSPAVGANLQTAPTEVTMTFDDELDPDLSHFMVTDANLVRVGSGEVDLTVADRNVMKGPVTISNPGAYTVNYTVAGVDEHALEGTFSFGYRTTEAIPNATGDEDPDTAMRPAGPLSPPILVGTLLLLIASVTAARRMARR